VAFFIKWHFLSSGIFYQVAFFIKWHYSCTINHQPDSLAKELCLTPCYPPPTAMTVRSPPRVHVEMLAGQIDTGREGASTKLFDDSPCLRSVAIL
jgi:hypothetical protein